METKFNNDAKIETISFSKVENITPSNIKINSTSNIDTTNYGKNTQQVEEIDLDSLFSKNNQTKSSVTIETSSNTNQDINVNTNSLSTNNKTSNTSTQSTSTNVNTSSFNTSTSQNTTTNTNVDINITPKTSTNSQSTTTSTNQNENINDISTRNNIGKTANTSSVQPNISINTGKSATTSRTNTTTTTNNSETQQAQTSVNQQDISQAIGSAVANAVGPILSPIVTQPIVNTITRVVENINTSSTPSITSRYHYSNDAVSSIIDIQNLDYAALTAEQIANFVGQLNHEQYNEFISGMENYYDSQADCLRGMLNGTDTFMGVQPLYDYLYNYDEIVCGNDAINPEHITLNNIEMAHESLRLMWQNLSIHECTMEEINAQRALIEEYESIVNEVIAQDATLAEYGVTNYNELIELRTQLYQMIPQLQYGISLNESNSNSAKFDYLNYLQDYNDYEYPREFTERELEYVNESRSGSIGYQGVLVGVGLFSPTPSTNYTYNYENFHENHPRISPVSYALMVEQLNPNGNYRITGLPENIETIVGAINNYPNIAKTYEYLYDQDESDAEDYVEACEYEFVQIEAQLQANEFLNTLGEMDGNENDFLEALGNEFGVAGAGVIEGLNSFVEGCGYTLEAITTGAGLTEENREQSVSELRRMYIIQALYGESNRESMGLICQNENGEYVNTDPNSIIDYTKNYFINFSWDTASNIGAHTYQIGQGIGNMLPSIALSQVCPLAGSIALGISAGGNAYHTAMVGGHSYLSSVIYGIVSGASESVSERILGGLPGLSETKVTSLRTYLASVARESNQEMFQGVMDAAYQAMVMGETLPPEGGWQAFAEDILQQGIYGGITAGIINMPSLTHSAITVNQLNQIRQQLNISEDVYQETLNNIRTELGDEHFSLNDTELQVVYANAINLQMQVQAGNISQDAYSNLIHNFRFNYQTERGQGIRSLTNLEIENKYANEILAVMNLTRAGINEDVAILMQDKRRGLTLADGLMLTNYQRTHQDINLTNITEAEIEQILAQPKQLSDGVKELREANPNITEEQIEAIDRIHSNDPSIDITSIVPEVAPLVLQLQETVMQEGMTLSEYANQTTESVINEEVQAEASNLAEQSRVLVEQIEPRVSSDLQSLEGNGIQLVSFDSRFKDAESLIRKIITDATSDNISLETAAYKISDVLRYTMVCDVNTYTSDVFAVLNELRERGYTVDRIRNAFTDGSEFYRGINTKIITPDGYMFELQFHTQQSYDIKEDKGHIYYEIARSGFSSDTAIDISDNIRHALAELVQVPQGVERVTIENINGLETEINPELIELNQSQPILISEDATELSNQISDIRNLQEIPEGYTSIEEYKRDFIRNLVNSNEFESMTNDFISQNIAQDPTMLNELINNSERVENIFINYYLKEDGKYQNFTNSTFLDNIPLNEVETLLNKPRMVEYIQSLNPSELAEFIAGFNKVYGESVNTSTAFIDAICRFDANELIEFQGMYSVMRPSYRTRIGGNEATAFNSQNSLRLYEYISNQILTEDNLSILKQLQYTISDLTMNSYGMNDSTIAAYIKTYIETKIKTLEQTVRNNILNSSDIELIAGDSLSYQVEAIDKYYDIVYEINGEENTIHQYITRSKVFDVENFLIGNPKIFEAIANNTFRLRDIRVNETMSNLVLKEETGIVPGINYITCNVDGEIRNIIGRAISFYGSGLTLDISSRFQNATNVEILNVTPLGKVNVDVTESDINKIYRVTYMLDGEENTVYLPVSTDLGHNRIDIEGYLKGNGLFGATDFQVSEANIGDILHNSARNLSSFNDIFTSDKYGGNQSDVSDIIHNYLINNNLDMNSIDYQKAKQMMELITNVFPNINELGIDRIARQYAETGCHYMAIANAFATYIGSIPNGEQIFRERFGFDLIVRNGTETSYNLEALALDLFLDNVRRTRNGDLSHISDIRGYSTSNVRDYATNYFAERGIRLDFNTSLDFGPHNNINSFIAHFASNPDSMFILSASYFDLEMNSQANTTDQALANASTEGKILKNIGGHAMFITDFDADGNITVSTWGQQARFINEALNDSTRLITAHTEALRFELMDEVQPTINTNINQERNINPEEQIETNATLNDSDQNTVLLKPSFSYMPANSTINEQMELYREYNQYRVSTINTRETILGQYRYEVNNSNKNAIYRIRYELFYGDAIVSRTCEEYIDSTYVTDDGVLDIGAYIRDNELWSARNIEITELTPSDILEIKNSSKYDDIFIDNGRYSYGGDQSTAYGLVRERFNILNALRSNTNNDVIFEKKTATIINLIRNAFPDASNTDIIKITNNYANRGCEYMSFANAFISYISNLPNGEQIFRERFGFDLTVTDGEEVSYNLEALALDIFIDQYKTPGLDLDGEELRTIKNPRYIEERDYKGYFESRGFRLENYMINGLTNSSFLHEILTNPDMIHIIGSEYYNLYDLYDERVVTGRGRRHHGHAMIVTDITDAGDIIVSSWGRKYRFVDTTPSGDGWNELRMIGFSYDGADNVLDMPANSSYEALENSTQDVNDHNTAIDEHEEFMEGK